MSFLPSLCTSSKNQQSLEMQGPDQNQDTNAILPPIFHHPQLKSIPPLTLSTQNPVVKMPQSGKRFLPTPRSSRQYPPRISGVIQPNSNLNSTISSTNIDAGISVPPSIKPAPPLNSLRKRNGNARRYKNNNNIILPPLENVESINDMPSDPMPEQMQQQQMQLNDKMPFLPTDVGDVYMGSGNDLSDELDEEEDEDEMFLRMNSGRLENASNRVDDELDDD